MDTSFWTQLQPDIRITAPTQLFYGKYPYKLDLEITGAAMLRDQADFATQMSNWRQSNYGGSWRIKKIPSANDLKILTALREWRSNMPVNMKMRIEDPGVQLYAETEDELKAFVLKTFDGDYHWLKIATGPKTAADLDLLKTGCVIKPKRRLDFKFKFIIRDGRYSQETRTSVLNILQAQGDQVRIPPATLKMLGKDKHDYIWNAYFYANDEAIHLMVSLVAPTMVRTVDRFL